MVENQTVARSVTAASSTGEPAVSGQIEQIAQLESQHLFSTYKRSPLYIERGSGVTVYDLNGKAYTDLLAGIAVNALGYCHPRIVRAIAEQSAAAIHISNLFYHPFQGQLAQKLAAISGLQRVFFCNSGTEANEAALKIARAYAKKNGDAEKHEIIALEGSFHGRTLGALSATSTEKYRKPYEPLIPGVVFVGRNNLADLEQKIGPRTCAVILEPIQGESGVYPLSGDFLRLAADLCARHNALLILDEVQCGLGRTGRYFCFQKFDIKPDLLTVAKPLGGGLPLGAVIGSEKVTAVLSPGDHGSTFGGGPLACRVALEFLAILEEDNLLAHVAEVGDHLISRLKRLQDRFTKIREVRGEGLIVGIEFSDSARPIFEKLLEAGFITNCVHENVLRLLPPYIIQKAHIDSFIDALATILSSQ